MWTQRESCVFAEPRVPSALIGHTFEMMGTEASDLPTVAREVSERVMSLLGRPRVVSFLVAGAHPRGWRNSAHCRRSPRFTVMSSE